MAVIGIAGISISLFLICFKLKNMLYYHPPQVVMAAVLNKIGIHSKFIDEPIEPGRPGHINFPDPGNDSWKGHGAQKAVEEQVPK